MKLTIGSLFSGYLGLDLGVRSVFPGAREAWVSDVDKGAAANSSTPACPAGIRDALPTAQP